MKSVLHKKAAYVLQTGRKIFSGVKNTGKNCATLDGTLAQSVEQRTFNPLVGSSSLPRPTKLEGLTEMSGLFFRHFSKLVCGCVVNSASNLLSDLCVDVAPVRTRQVSIKAESSSQRSSSFRNSSLTSFSLTPKSATSAANGWSLKRFSRRLPSAFKIFIRPSMSPISL